MPDPDPTVPWATPVDEPEPAGTPAGMDTAVSRFESRLRKGLRPSLAAFLPPPGPSRLPALVELVHSELEFRLKAGESARVEEYLARFPELRDSPAVAGLAHAEYRHRRRTDPALTWDEFRTRFPGVPEPTTDFVPDATPVAEPVEERFIPTAPSGYEVEGELGRGGMGSSTGPARSGRGGWSRSR